MVEQQEDRSGNVNDTMQEVEKDEWDKFFLACNVIECT